MRKTQEIQAEIDKIDQEIADKMKVLQRLKVELAYSFMHLPLPEGAAPVTEPQIIEPILVLSSGVLNERR